MVRLLVLGTGNWAQSHARFFSDIPTCRIVGAVDANPERLYAFCTAHGIANSFPSLDEALAWDGFDAVSNVTPDPVHHPTTMQLIAAGKHVFCEKPLAETYPLAREMADAIAAAGLVGMVNLTYRNVPALQQAQGMIAAGAIGAIRHVEASYRQSWLVANNWGDWRKEERWLWRLSQAHGSRGVLGDIGIHILDFVTYALGMEPIGLQARMHTFSKAPGDRIGPYALDANDSVVLSLAFPNGALGVVQASRFMTGYDNTLRLQAFGTEGALEIEHSHARSILRACDGPSVHTQAWREVICPPVATNYAKFIRAIEHGERPQPDFEHGARLQKVLDACWLPEAQAGLPLSPG
ncbi:Gfo/Idh/MocA family protein [Marinivivus vitaminiproducens]|uniref:Gfo/Idh/MocA family protein n=1 Tax=Marinivivus vitaminiproducens TaxID=3035935 RepID=UPI0027A8A6AF|nr:Gfo/Idh/MocA family oxidoreductase [Geminicoccaceae bacterium SCSIO 64248]